uniref:Uncharacterized protein n=1 Tax=Steinernema glaseri TaxID=37863 RepID=A0A1I7XX72_9BILA
MRTTASRPETKNKRKLTLSLTKEGDETSPSRVQRTPPSSPRGCGKVCVATQHPRRTDKRLLRSDGRTTNSPPAPTYRLIIIGRRRPKRGHWFISCAHISFLRGASERQVTHLARPGDEEVSLMNTYSIITGFCAADEQTQGPSSFETKHEASKEENKAISYQGRSNLESMLRVQAGCISQRHGTTEKQLAAADSVV